MKNLSNIYMVSRTNKTFVVGSMLVIANLCLWGCQTRQHSVFAHETLDQAKWYFNSGQYRNAFETVKPLAQKKRLADAKYLLGYLYFFGHGVATDRKEAIAWFEKAKAQGHRDATIALEKIANYQGSVLPQPVNLPKQSELSDKTRLKCQQLRFQNQTHQKSYTLQIIGLSSIKNLHRLCTKLSFDRALYYYQTCRKGHPWYVLVTEPYQDYHRARQALGELPSSLQSWRPFIKTMLQVNQERKQSC